MSTLIDSSSFPAVLRFPIQAILNLPSICLSSYHQIKTTISHPSSISKCPIHPQVITAPSPITPPSAPSSASQNSPPPDPSSHSSSSAALASQQEDHLQHSLLDPHADPLLHHHATATGYDVASGSVADSPPNDSNREPWLFEGRWED